MNGLIELFEDIQQQSGDMDSALNKDLLVAEIKEVIYESRSKLYIFKLTVFQILKSFWRAIFRQRHLISLSARLSILFYLRVNLKSEEGGQFTTSSAHKPAC